MIEQLKTIRHHLEPLKNNSGVRKALTALTQLEAMVGEQEPVAWLCIVNTADAGPTKFFTAPSDPRGFPVYATPVAQQYEAGDVASAAAQGFRDGVASVTQQEPVAWRYQDARGHYRYRGYVAGFDKEYSRLKPTPLYTAAPVAQQPQAEATERESFEAWARYFSTLPVDRDAHGYIDMNVQMMWHAWQASKKNAPEGASWGESDAKSRLGLARPDSTCQHQFALQPSSGMLLCANCGLSEVAAKKAARAQPQQAEAVPPDVVRDAERYRWLFSSHTEAELAECDQKSLQPPHTKQDETLALLGGWYTTKEQADKVIDAANAQQKGGV